MSTSKDMRKGGRKGGEAGGWNRRKQLGARGVRSNDLYGAGRAAVGLSCLSWLVSRGKDDAKAQSDRWGIFVGQWAPTLFAIGVGLKLEEDS